MKARRGAALLVAVWLMFAAGAIVATSVREARVEAWASANRTALLAASWRAEGCAHRAVATIERALATGAQTPTAVRVRWLSMDSTVGAASEAADCATELRLVRTATESLPLAPLTASDAWTLVVRVGAADVNDRAPELAATLRQQIVRGGVSIQTVGRWVAP